MDYKNELTRDEAIFFLDMVGSVKSPNKKTKSTRVKPYYSILNDRDSDDFKKFIDIYKSLKHILPERKQMIMDEIYGINKPGVSLKTVASSINITRERVRQICHEAEVAMAKEIVRRLGGISNLKQA
ncbi:sigma factor-like helix-turn-helix DNA-binding protein [Virgibacillus sp. DJP39]|uniref:sigma factor-like helix-turn-helix DNA-binding protein n=1 Tax=Virgibacillus sp. DJP39 TaxID=3409790 RepID=UPI003BB5190A